jgi:peptidyl-prolyl cis-trans isomerase D
MFGTIRKHQTWLWVVIITLTIISFVVFFSPYSKMKDDGRNARYGSIDGQEITREAFGKAGREAYLRYFFMTGQWPDAEAQKRGFDEQREAYQWLFLIKKQEEMGIHVSSDASANIARQMLRPFERGNVSSPDVFVKQVLQPRGFNLDDFERFVRHYIGLQELMSVAGLSGQLATPAEIQSLYERENQQVSAAAIVLPLSNYLAQVTVLPDAVSQFYSNRLATYRLPDRVRVDYVRFAFTNFQADAEKELAGMTNLAGRIEAVYAQGGTNLFPDAKTPEATKQKIREQMRKELSVLAARRKANEFATAVYDKVPPNAATLTTLAKERGIPVLLSQPFDRTEPPSDLNVGQPFAVAAFRLSPTNEPFGGPIVGEDAVYFMALNQRIPSEIPSLDSIRERVVSDYRLTQAQMLARQAGTAFQQTLTNGLAQGKSAADLAKAANLKLLDLPPFSISTRSLPVIEDQINLNQLKQLAFTAPVGGASQFVPTQEGGIIVVVKAKLPIDQEKMKQDLPQFAQAVRQSRQNEAFNEWFRREADRGLRDTPLGRPQTPPDMQSGKAAPAKS